MERLVDRYIRDEALEFDPLHPKQNAYQTGKSVKHLFINSLHGLRKRLTHKPWALL
jgi:hypothetical protein